MKILFIGNSITLHTPAPQLGWNGNYGMAASCEASDYVHRLCGMLAGAGKTTEPMVVNIAGFERAEKTVGDLDFEAWRAFDADAAVINIGENVSAESLPAFETAFPQLISRLGCSRVFCVGGFWENDRVDEIMQNACERFGCVFLSLKALQNEKYRAIGLFEHPGVAGHPSDSGMEAIAERVFAAFEAAGLTEKAVVYPIPAGETVSHDYTVTVDGQVAECYRCEVSKIPFNRPWPGQQRPDEQHEEASFVYFDMTAPVSVTVTPRKAFTEAVLRPLSKNIALKNENGSIRFQISAPGQFSLEIDGRHHNLHIFANPVKAYKRTDDVIYYGPGVHHAGRITLEDGQTLLIDAGAVVYASVKAVNASDIRVMGRGILDYSDFERHDPLEFETDGLVNLVNCSNVLIDGVILRNSSWWSISAFNCVGLDYQNVKTIGMWKYNTDGFDFVNSRHVHVSDCFLRNFDDVIVLKGMRVFNIRNGEQVPLRYEEHRSLPMNVQHYLVERCVIWCDWGGSLEIGAETVADEYSDIVFRDIDIIRNADGGMRIHSGDRAVIHDVTYSDIRVEYSGYDRPSVMQTSDDMRYAPEDKPALPPVICGWMYRGVWTDDMLFGNIYDVAFRNIRVLADDGIPVPAVRFDSADDTHRFDGITIDGLYFNGKRLTDKAEGNFTANRFTGSVTLL